MNSSPLNSTTQFTAVDFDPFAEGEVLLTAPATESQKEIWASVQMGDDANCAYNESQTLRLCGSLQVEAMQAAFQTLIERHESLRMTLSPDGTTLCINANQILDVPLADLSNLDESERQTQLNLRIRNEVKQPFDLEHGPLFRVQIVRLNASEHRVLMTAHHIICDGWSWGVLVPELGQIYSALTQGITPELEAPDRFSDYAITLEDSETNGDAIAAENFWLNQFAQSIPVLDFPTDRPRPAFRTFNSDREDWRIDAALITQLKQFGTQMGCSFTTTMLAAFEVFLHRLVGQEEIVVGLPAAGQADSGNYNLVGHCVNLLPLRTTVDAAQPFRTYLKQRQSKVLDAYEHQQLTFGKLVQKLPIPRDPSRIPLVSVVFNIDQGLQGNKLPFNGLEGSFFANPRAFENFELFINAVDNPDGLVMECQYNTNLFDRKTIKTRLAEFEILLTGIVSNPDRTIAELPLLTPDEQQWLEQQNQTAAEFPNHLCLHQLFEEQVKRSPDRVAVIFANQQLTYQELDTQANQLAYYLKELGVQPEVTVGICVERSLDMMVGVLGILKAGGAYVPLDPAYPKERLDFLMQDAQVTVLLTQQTGIKANLPETSAQIVYLDQDWTSQAAAQPDLSKPPMSGVTADNLAYIIYTSGSTGKPKGVQIPHRNAANLLNAVQQKPGLAAQDTLISVTTLSFDIAVAELFLPLSVGARLVLVSRDVATDGHQLMHQMSAVTATYLQATPATWRLLLAAGWEGSPGMKIISTGEALPRDLANQLIHKGASLWNLYGPTETTIWSAGYQIESTDGPITIGYPLLNTQVYILDTQMKAVPVGVAGELYIGGAGLARGYLNRPELTAEKFVPNPFSSEPLAKLYKTGDLARFLPNGQIECLGRIDYQVKVRGFRIELGEVESTLAKHPSVQDCAVVAWKNEASDERLVAYIIGKRGDEGATVGELRTFMKQKVPDFMVPSNFVLMDALPLTPNGKVDRKALPQPDVARSLAENYVAPRSEIEKEMADIWSQTLKLERVGIHDNFFELGGHSLLAAQLLSRIRQKFAVELQLRLLFEASTVAELTERLETIRWAAQGSQKTDNETATDFEEGEL
jgi:amino acid adenylation domain-containing protein